MSALNNRPKLVFLIILFCIANGFWLIANTYNVYDNAVMGAIFEILWLPMIAATIAVPVLSIIFFFKDGRSAKSWFLYIAIVSLLLLAFYLLQ